MIFRAPNSGLTQTCESRKILDTVGKSCVNWNALLANTSSCCVGNGMNSVEAILTPTKAVRVAVSDDTLTVDLEDGRTISVPIVWYPRLAYATPLERSNFEIAGAGYGIHWPDLDEDIGVDGLLLGKRSTESQASFARWLARRQQA